MEKSGYVGLSVSAKASGKSLFHYSFGYSDISKSEPFSADTIVALGSNTKVVTAALIHELGEKASFNKTPLDINKPVNEYLKDGIRGGNKVTLKYTPVN